VAIVLSVLPFSPGFRDIYWIFVYAIKTQTTKG
jgi:hypothetical protein